MSSAEAAAAYCPAEEQKIGCVGCLTHPQLSVVSPTWYFACCSSAAAPPQTRASQEPVGLTAQVLVQARAARTAAAARAGWATATRTTQNAAARSFLRTASSMQLSTGARRARG